MQPAAFKLCPQCQQPAAMPAAFCSQCGRAFRTTAGTAAPRPVLPVLAAKELFAVLRRLPVRVKIGAVCLLVVWALASSPHHSFTLRDAQQVQVGMDVFSVENKIGQPDYTSGNLVLYVMDDGRGLMLTYEYQRVVSAVIISNAAHGIESDLH